MLTLAIINTIITSRLGGLLDEAGITDISPAIAFGVVEAEGSVADLSSATNAEVAAVSNEMLLLDLVEYRCVLDIIGNLAMVDITTGPRKEALGQLTKFALEYKENLEEKLKNLYGYGAATLEAAKITDMFVQHYIT